MKSIYSTEENHLTWVLQDAHYELHAGDEVLATLERQGARTDHATANTAEDMWSLDRSGTIRKLVTIFRGTTDKFGLFLQRHGPQRRLLLLEGTLYTWKPAYELGRHVWKFLDGQDQCLFYVYVGPALPLNATVELVPCARNEPLLPLLLVLGWFELWMECLEASHPRAGSTA